ncbi:MAG: VCBS repeat-containing protein [Planctomycetes bacterium]|nr:VCBS repeat-containing protein [Planctomycetota bacterium]
MDHTGPRGNVSAPPQLVRGGPRGAPWPILILALACGEAPPQPGRGPAAPSAVAITQEPGAAESPAAPGSHAEQPDLGRAAHDGSGQAPFRARRERLLDLKPEGLCAADLDGDGWDDLAATLVSPGGLCVWRGSAEGLSRQSTRVPCGDFPLAPLALPPESFGADRGRALALASRGARTLEVHSPTHLGPSTRSWELEHRPRALAAGFLAGGAVLAAACDGRRLELLRDGAAQPEHWTLGAEWPRCALVSTELGAVVVGFQGAGAVEAYATADGAPTHRLTLGGMPRALAELDVDGDGDLELAIAGGDRELWIAGLGNPGGARAWFEGTPAAWPVDAIPIGLSAADFDRDGRQDLVLLHHYQLSALVLSGLSATGPRSRTGIYAGQTPGSLAVLDVDGDGLLDVAVANRDTQGIGLLLGDGAGGLESAASVPLGEFPNALASAGDAPGPLRLASIDAKSNSVSTVVRRAGSSPSSPTTVEAGRRLESGSEARAPRLVEFDGRPGLDLLFLATGPAGARLMRAAGDEQGGLTPLSPLELGGAASDLLTLDVDAGSPRAGGLELVLCDPNAALVTIREAEFLGGQGGQESPAAGLRVPSSPRALAAIELDGDPAPEMACLLAAPGERVGVAWLDARRDAQGRLSLVELGFTPLAGAPLDAAGSDLDGDGRQDLAVLTLSAPGSTQGQWCALLSGAGPAEFRVAATLNTGLRPHRLAAADVDGDGRAEVFVAAQDSHLINGWTAAVPRGAAELSLRAFDDLGAGLGPLDLVLTDLDGDGRIDLCVANGFSNDLSVLYGRNSSKAISKPNGR